MAPTPTIPARRTMPFSRLRDLVRDRRGGALIEFAFVATPLMALLVAIVQVSMTFFAQQNLETTAEKSVRSLITGSTQKANLTQAQFNAAMCKNLPAFMKCANLMVDVNVATSFADVSTNPPTITYASDGTPNNVWSYNTGKPGDIVVVKSMYLWDTEKGPLGFDLSTLSNKKRLLIATSVFKTENY